LMYRKTPNTNELFGRESQNNDSPLANNSNASRTLHVPPGACKFPSFEKGTITAGRYESGVIVENDFEVIGGINSTTMDITFNSKWTQTYLENELGANTHLIIKNIKYLSPRYQRDISGRIAPDKYLDANKFDIRTNEYGRKQLIDMFDGSITNTFDYPKNTPLIKTLINMTDIDNKSATILDFFAGSGTTGHAVMELNKEDGGNRNFILCTNNEVSDDLVRTHFFNEGHIKKNNKTEFNKFVKEHPDVHQAF